MFPKEGLKSTTCCVVAGLDSSRIAREEKTAYKDVAVGIEAEKIGSRLKN